MSEDDVADEQDEFEYQEPHFYSEPRVRREPIIFVKSTGTEEKPNEPASTSRKSIADQYRSVVLCDTVSVKNSSVSTPSDETVKVQNLDLISTTEGRGIAHQLSSQYVRPPSAIDRKRKGLQYMQAQGWDPDDRAGIGLKQDGIAFPIKAVEKTGKGGLGTVTRSSDSRSTSPSTGVQKLGVKQMQRAATEEKRRHKRLQRLFYQDDRVERYLGEGA